MKNCEIDIAGLRPGDYFIHDYTLYVRVFTSRVEDNRVFRKSCFKEEKFAAVNITNGDIKLFDKNTIVKKTDAFYFIKPKKINDIDNFNEVYDETCGDNRFEIIEKAKQDLLTKTNIETSPDEMMVLEKLLFRCWQMGWLQKYE